MTDDRDAVAADEQQRARAYLEQLKQLHATDLGLDMALSIVSFGTQKLGLAEGTEDLRDLNDSRVSIELLRAVLDVLDRQGVEAPVGELRAALANLQLAYAHAVRVDAEGKAGAGAQAAGDAAATGDEPATGDDTPADGDGPERSAAGPGERPESEGGAGEATPGEGAADGSTV